MKLRSNVTPPAPSWKSVLPSKRYDNSLNKVCLSKSVFKSMIEWDTCLARSCHSWMWWKNLCGVYQPQTHSKQLCRRMEIPYQLEWRFSSEAKIFSLKKLLKSQKYSPTPDLRLKIWPKSCSLCMKVIQILKEN